MSEIRKRRNRINRRGKRRSDNHFGDGRRERERKRKLEAKVTPLGRRGREEREEMVTWRGEVIVWSFWSSGMLHNN